MGKNKTKAEKAKRNQEYAKLHKKKSGGSKRPGRYGSPAGARPTEGAGPRPATPAPGPVVQS